MVRPQPFQRSWIVARRAPPRLVWMNVNVCVVANGGISDNALHSGSSFERRGSAAVLVLSAGLIATSSAL